MIRPQLIDFQRIPGYANLLEKLSKKPSRILISLPRSVRLPFLASLQKDLQRTVLFVTSKSDRLQSMHDEFSFWNRSANQYLFSEPTSLFYERSLWDIGTRADRIETLLSLAKQHIPGKKNSGFPSVIFSSVKAVMTKSIPRREFISNLVNLQVGEAKELNSIVSKLVKLNHDPVEIVTRGGQFSRRGGIIDVWPINYPQPIRIEFFGDEIDTMRTFDPATQRSTGRIDEILVPPAMEILNQNQEEGLDVQPARQSEFDIPFIYPDAGTIINYLPKNALIIFDNASALKATAEEIESQSLKIRDENISAHLIPADIPSPYFSWSELIDEMSFRYCIDLGFPLEENGHIISQYFSPSPRFGSRINDLFKHLNQSRKILKNVFIVSKQSERVREVQKDSVIDEKLASSIHYIDGSLNSGWKVTYSDNEVNLLFTDSELFGWDLPKPRQQKKRAISTPENIIFDFHPGDYVVHVDYGIAVFSGLVHRSIENVEKDYLLLQFADNDELFVPVHQADRITFFIGPDNRKPKLSKLGTDAWKKSRNRTRIAVKKIAFDLLELYAKRQTVDGYAFSSDTEWQHALESSFPYRETPDQVQAIKEVKEDMEKARPMDRLLCGDVGYGKTEVAIRAAFKAVMDNKQAAMLVPTTVLAQQHYQTFKSRLSPFPVKIEMLSRFRTIAEQSRILRELEDGALDIVIGTHRLLQTDVHFNKLGLLIIDEEQRFGVAHKEYFKRMRQEIDVLTLTATPIPRTLYMALAGIRDISVINSPPAERLPIQTFTGPYDEKIVRRAIIREIDRGGQIFFVHNRVQSIRTVASKLGKLVPEAKIGIAHGQMKEKLLANVMEKFTTGEIDVLLSTSIIESGLDIPNANTLILDRADTFGLSQLYQLRGRVGRGSSRAYAYFFHHNRKMPTPEGLERLEVIAENTQLGAGYSIAMRDLEMRGAGDLLGSEQHGYIASVGFHLYTRLLAEAVQGLKTGTDVQGEFTNLIGDRPIKPLVNIELPINALIPSSYISDDGLRLQLYRRIAEIDAIEEIAEIQTELADRFGDPPEYVNNLLLQLRIKLKAEESGLKGISFENNYLVLRFPPAENKNSTRILPVLGPNIRRGKNTYWIPIDGKKDWAVRLLRVLDDLKEKLME